MSVASDYAIGAILGQHLNKIFHIIYYESKTLSNTQKNYTTAEKELLVVVYVLGKFRSYFRLGHNSHRLCSFEVFDSKERYQVETHSMGLVLARIQFRDKRLERFRKCGSWPPVLTGKQRNTE